MRESLSINTSADTNIDIAVIDLEYNFIKMLGTGSRGSVGLYEHSKTYQKVAIKSILCMRGEERANAMAEYELLRRCG